MARHGKPVLKQRIFEARYEQGYRYLDRCGDTMVILEGLLTEQTKLVWLPTEMVPTGARMQCPELDVHIVFNAYTLVVDQNPVGDVECDFDKIALAALSTLVARFDLQKIRRFGARRLKILPVESDSIDGADALSVQLFPVKDWRKDRVQELTLRAVFGTSVFELPDRSKGIRIETKPFAKIGADLKIDERLKVPPHLLHTKQREALVEQLKRAKQRQHDPEAGLSIDIDYYWVWPPKEASPDDFLTEAQQEADRLETDFLSKGGHR